MDPYQSKPFSELPADADLTKPEWSYNHAGLGGVIRHCTVDGLVTEYPIPLILIQVVSHCERIAVDEVRAPILKALGL